MEDEGMDMCENLWNHEMTMRRLLSLLRQSQSTCTDTECFTVGTNQTNDNGFMMMTLCWIAIAFFLYMFRPASLRNQEHDLKPHNNGNEIKSIDDKEHSIEKNQTDGEGGNPPASPNVF